MNWDSFAAFVHMGGYGFYVWSSFGAVVIVIFLELLQLWLRQRRLSDADVRAREGEA